MYGSFNSGYCITFPGPVKGRKKGMSWDFRLVLEIYIVQKVLEHSSDMNQMVELFSVIFFYCVLLHPWCETVRLFALTFFCCCCLFVFVPIHVYLCSWPAWHQSDIGRHGCACSEWSYCWQGLTSPLHLQSQQAHDTD